MLSPLICTLQRTAVPVSLIVAMLTGLFGGGLVFAEWTGAPSPHDGQSMVLVRPDRFRVDEKTKATIMPDKTAVFGEVANLDKPLTAKINVKKSAKYDLWVRIASGDKQSISFSHELIDRRSASPASVLKGKIESATNDLKADPKNGGPSGYAAYSKIAQQSGAIGRTEVSGDKKTAAANTKKLAGIEDDLLADIAKDQGAKPAATNWNHFTRIEPLVATRPAYWWRLGTVDLTTGEYALHLSPSESNTKAKPLQIETALLTTAQGLDYPFRGDIDASPASYIRFRFEEAIAAPGVFVNATIKMHYDPFSTGRVSLNPSNMSSTKTDPHTAKGFTRWYRLQDIERAPVFGKGEGHLLLEFTDSKRGSVSKPKGVTQFAVFPHDDFVLREIDWNEPDGTLISFHTDFEGHLHQLRTFRDHAREHYEMALQATNGRVFPLTRGELYFGNAWANASSEAADYMVKTLRVLGFNCVGEQADPTDNRARYGWSSHAGHYRPPTLVPFNESESRRKFDEHYRDYFGKMTEKQRDFYRGVTIFQIADEPIEIARSEMSSPLWRFTKDAIGEKYEDVTGGSQLATKRSDWQDIVLEGKIEDHSRWVGFRVWFDQANDSAKFAEWRVGQVSPSREMNVATHRQGIASPTTSVFQRPGAIIGPKPIPFKVVFTSNAAELYLNGKRISQHNKLPAKGGFAIIGGEKAVRDLQLRPVRKEERIVGDGLDSNPTSDKTKPADDLDTLLKDPPAKDAALKPIQQAIREDWQPAGGMPEAHRGFREWAQQQGLTPQLFGEKTWDEVRMLTVPNIVTTPAEARLFYWSRRYSSYLTSHMFGLSADAIQKNAPNPKMRGFVALSGHSLNFPSEMPLDMFQLGGDTSTMIPGISDWMTTGGWRWDSHQSVAYSVAMFNAGARRYGEIGSNTRPDPISFPMMHCVFPYELRSYTMLANNCRYISFYNFGPSYAATEGFWSEAPTCYQAVHRTTNRVAQVDDVLVGAVARPSRVALLYSMANEYWNSQASFADKRATFLALSHEYYQPELVTEEQIAAGALAHYDALYVVEPVVKESTQQKITEWTHAGGLLWACADAGRFNEFNEPCDLMRKLISIDREFPAPSAGTPTSPPVRGVKSPGPAFTVTPIKGKSDFRPHAVAPDGMPLAVKFAPSANLVVRAEYQPIEKAAEGAQAAARPAWLETQVGKGRVIYVGHRVGRTYSLLDIRPSGFHDVWGGSPRPLLSTPLSEHKVSRELSLSEPAVMATPMTNDQGTVVILFNVRGRELKNVRAEFKEPAKPIGVQTFANDRLVDLPFEFNDGKVVFTLPELAKEQMVVVRRKPATADDRWEAMWANAEKSIQSTDPKTVSAGAWFIGMLGQRDASLPADQAKINAERGLKSVTRLSSLLTHPHWTVRRAAAEALGRLGSPTAAESLARALQAEKDRHVAGDLAIALASLGDARFVEHYRQIPRDQWKTSLSLKFIARAWKEFSSFHKRSETSTATKDRSILSKQDFAQLAWQGVDPAARRDLWQVLCDQSDESTLRDLLRAVIQNESASTDSSQLAEVIAQNEVLTSEALAHLDQCSDELFLSLATHIADAKLIPRLLRQVETSAISDYRKFALAALKQRSDELSRELFRRQANLPAALQSYLPLIWEGTYDAQLGSSGGDWEQFFQKNGK